MFDSVTVILIVIVIVCRLLRGYGSEIIRVLVS